MNMAESLGPKGPFVHHVTGFAPRAAQQTMAAAVADALRTTATLIAEAGTGTGKTFAYLVPALLSDKKVVVSTGTRNLQDQLFHKDLPVVRKALAKPLRTALLKGRSNYLCLHRFALVEQSGRFASREQAVDFQKLRRWAGETREGDIGEVSGVAEQSTLWPRVTSTVDNCLGQECPCLQDCHVLKARRRAQEADVVVINHHLFFADMMLRQEAFGELLPGADAFIMDEAHQLPELAGQFFGHTLSSRQLNDLARDTVAEQLRDAGDFIVLQERARRLETAVAALRLALGKDSRRGFWRDVVGAPSVPEATQELGAALAGLQDALQLAAERGKGLQSCWKRSMELRERLTLLSAAQSGDHAHWFETQTRGFTLNLTPLDIAPAFGQAMRDYQSAWIFTSATLSVGGRFDHFALQLGLEGARSLRLDSPFDFARNAVLYHPRGLPDPSSANYTRALAESSLPVLEASRGRAFMLFTSHRALREAAATLANRVEYPLLVQGDRPKGELLARFRELGNAVLLGTSSFWEGVDVRGDALSCVIIAKLPFSAPSDPVLQARIDAIRRRGGDPFWVYQLPHAVIALKQGVGRLIRDVEDRGVLVLCDPRLVSRGYGKVFLDSLPPMTRTRQLERVQRFFAPNGAQCAAEAWAERP